MKSSADREAGASTAVVDAHTHLSLYQGNARSLVEAKAALLSEMGRCGVDRAVVIPDNADGHPEIAGLETALMLVGDDERFALLGSPNVLDGHGIEVQRHEALMEDGTIHGLKFFPGHEPYYPTDRRCLPFYVAAATADLPVVFHTGENVGDPTCARFNDPRYIVEVAERYPSLKIVIAHYFWPKLEYCYQVTRDTPNIYFELAGTADRVVVQASGGIDVVTDVLKRTIADRPDHVIFGSDWPMCGVQDHLSFVESLELDAKSRAGVLGDNATRGYRLT